MAEQSIFLLFSVWSIMWFDSARRVLEYSLQNMPTGWIGSWSNHKTNIKSSSSIYCVPPPLDMIRKSSDNSQLYDVNFLLHLHWHARWHSTQQLAQIDKCVEQTDAILCRRQMREYAASNSSTFAYITKHLKEINWAWAYTNAAAASVFLLITN